MEAAAAMVVCSYLYNGPKSNTDSNLQAYNDRAQIAADFAFALVRVPHYTMNMRRHITTWEIVKT